MGDGLAGGVHPEDAAGLLQPVVALVASVAEGPPLRTRPVWQADRLTFRTSTGGATTTSGGGPSRPRAAAEGSPAGPCPPAGRGTHCRQQRGGWPGSRERGQQPRRAGGAREGSDHGAVGRWASPRFDRLPRRRRQARSTDPVLPAGGSGRRSLGHPAGTGAAQVSRAGRTAVSWSGVRRRDGCGLVRTARLCPKSHHPRPIRRASRRRISTMREHGARCGVLERPVRPTRATAAPSPATIPATDLGRRAHDLGLPGHEVAKLGRWTPCLSGRRARSMPRSTARRAATPTPSRSSTTSARRTSTA